MIKVNFDSIDKMIAGGKIDGMIKWYEKIYFLTVSAWREYLRSGLCKKEEATEAKLECRKEVLQIVNDVEHQMKLYDHVAFFFKEIELAASEYRKKRKAGKVDIETMDKMMEIVDRVIGVIDGKIRERNYD